MPVTTTNLKNVIAECLSKRKTDDRTSISHGVKPAYTKLKILVAEDVSTNQEIAREMITMLGHDVVVASNGQEALDLVYSSSFDLIFMDCQMPLMDGYEASRLIRHWEQQKSKRHTPIVALTAGLGQADKKKCHNAGMDYYVAKPFSISDIEQALSHCLGENYKPRKFERIKASFLVDERSENVAEFSEILNHSAIHAIKEIEDQTGKSILPSIFNGFIKQMEEKLQELQSHLYSRNSESFSKSAHAIKSMSANIGAESIRNISAQLEATAKSGNLSGLDKKLEELRDAYNQFLTAFTSVYID
jgi:CheY-like chemotaxis protein